MEDFRAIFRALYILGAVGPVSYGISNARLSRTSTVFYFSTNNGGHFSCATFRKSKCYGGSSARRLELELHTGSIDAFLSEAGTVHIGSCISDAL